MQVAPNRRQESCSLSAFLAPFVLLARNRAIARTCTRFPCASHTIHPCSWRAIRASSCTRAMTLARWRDAAQRDVSRSARQAALASSRVRARIRVRGVTLACCARAQRHLRHARRMRGGERCSQIDASKKMIRIFDALPRKRLGFGLGPQSGGPSALASPWPSLATRRIGTWRRSSLNDISESFCTLKGCKSLVCRIQHPLGC